MEVKNLNYGKIYKLIDNTNNKIYIGSTIRTLKERFSVHKNDYKRFLDGKTTNYCYSFKILENNDFKIELIETVNYNDKKELLEQERHYIKTLECVNKNIPNTFNELGKSGYNTKYRIDNKERIKANKQKYYNENKLKFKEYAKQYNITIRDMKNKE